MMSYFDKDFLLFLADLEVNNNREWFNANKERFKSKVEEPFTLFIQKLIDLLKKEGVKIKGEAKEAVFRIYRDVRFSKDKTPYKLHMSAIIGKGGRKDFNTPGIYIECTADKIKFYSGLYELDKVTLDKIRNRIKLRHSEFKKLYSAKNFKSVFKEILGTKAKRLDPKFNEISKIEPLLFNKSFYFICEEDSELLLGNKIEKWFLNAYKASKDLNDFLTV